MILKNISSNQLFESEGDEGINSQVSMIENKLLNDWLDQDNDIEYENYMKENENYNDKREKILEETDMEFEDNSWTKIKCRGWDECKTEKEEDWKEVKSKGWKKEDQQSDKMSFKRKENFYDTLYDNEEQLEDKFEKMEMVQEEV